MEFRTQDSSPCPSWIPLILAIHQDDQNPISLTIPLWFPWEILIHDLALFVHTICKGCAYGLMLLTMPHRMDRLTSVPGNVTQMNADRMFHYPMHRSCQNMVRCVYTIIRSSSTILILHLTKFCHTVASYVLLLSAARVGVASATANVGINPWVNFPSIAYYP